MAAVTPEREGLAIGLGTITGLGVGAVLVPAATIAITVTPDTIIATCVALSLSIRSIGGYIGYAIYYKVFINKITPKLPTYIAQYAIQAGLPASEAIKFVETFVTAPTQLANFPGVTAQIIEAATLGSRRAYSDSLTYVWYTSVPFGVCACVACLFLGNNSRYVTSRVAARIKN